MANYYTKSKNLYSILLVLLYKMLQDRSFFLDHRNDLIKNRMLFIEGAPVKDLFKNIIENFVGRTAKFKQYLEESTNQIQEPNFSLSNILECIDNLSNKQQITTIRNEATV